MGHTQNYILIWSLCIMLPSYGEENGYCETVDVSGLKYQLSRRGTYTALSSGEWCQTSHPSYRQKDGSNYLFFLETTSGWKGWIIGSSMCQNLAGVVVPYSSARDPTQVPSSVSWLELYNGNWVTNSDLSASCDTGLSTWDIIGIVFGVVVLIGVIVVLIVCCVHNSNKKPRSPHSAASRRVQVSPCNNTTLYRNPAYSNHMRPTIWSTNTTRDLQYQRPPDPCVPYSSMASNNNQRNTVTTELGPPPSYQESLSHTSNQPSNNQSAVAPIETSPPNVYAQTNDVRPVFSPPPQYSE